MFTFFFALAFGSSTLLVLKEPWNMFISSPPCYPGQGCSSPGLVESCPLHVCFSAQPMTQVDLLADVYRCFSLQPSFSLPNPKNSKLQVVPHCNLYLTQWDYCLHCGHLFSLLWFGKCPQNWSRAEELTSCVSFLSNITTLCCLLSSAWNQFLHYFVHCFSSL